MAHRPFTRRQALQNRRFLAALAETGNARAAARALGVHRATYTKRRAKCPAFARNWDAALAVAHAAIGGTVTFSATAEMPPAQRTGKSNCPQFLRTTGGEPVTVRLKSGRLQVRRAPPGRMTRAARQAFLAALAATCNVRLASAAAGFTHPTFYRLAERDPGFAREWRLARAEGHQRIEMALLAAQIPEAYEDDAWRHNDPLPIPPMTPQMAIQLLSLHRKRVDQGDLPPPLRRRPGESHEAVSMRLSLLYEARLERDREAWRVAEAARNAGHVPPEEEEGIPAMPQLDKVKGWSGADPGKEVHNPERAMFGGWRIEDWEKGRR